MKRDDLTTRNAAELAAMLESEQQKLAQLRFDMADKKLKKTSDIRAVRRRIARIMTALRNAK